MDDKLSIKHLSGRALYAGTTKRHAHWRKRSAGIRNSHFSPVPDGKYGEVIRLHEQDDKGKSQEEMEEASL